jgi:hypothetical protein
VSVEEIYYTINQLRELFKLVFAETPDAKFKLGDDISGFIAAAAKMDGWVVLPLIPEIEPVAQQVLNKLNHITTGTEQYITFSHMISMVRTVVENIEKLRPNKDSILAELDRLSHLDSMAFVHVRKILGCLVYSPIENNATTNA